MYFRVKEDVLRLGLLVFVLLLTGCISVDTATFWPGDDNQIAKDTLVSNEVEEVVFKTLDNESIYALHLPNKQSDILTLYFHGNGGNIHQRAGVLNKLRSLGTSVLGVSYRGYLNSSGSPSEQGLYLDSRAALEYAINTLGYSKENIVVMGRSLGSAVAIDLVQNESLHGVILVTPFENPRALLAIQGWFTRLMIKNTNNILDTAFQNTVKVKSFKSPTLVIHGTADEVIPFGQGKTVFDHISGEKEFVAIDGAMHSDFGFSDTSRADELYWTVIGGVLSQKK